jgi:hypothetical protein
MKKGFMLFSITLLLFIPGILLALHGIAGYFGGNYTSKNYPPKNQGFGFDFGCVYEFYNWDTSGGQQYLKYNFREKEKEEIHFPPIFSLFIPVSVHISPELSFLDFELGLKLPPFPLPSLWIAGTIGFQIWLDKPMLTPSVSLYFGYQISMESLYIQPYFEISIWFPWYISSNNTSVNYQDSFISAGIGLSFGSYIK